MTVFGNLSVPRCCDMAKAQHGRCSLFRFLLGSSVPGPAYFKCQQTPLGKYSGEGRVRLSLLSLVSAPQVRPPWLLSDVTEQIFLLQRGGEVGEKYCFRCCFSNSFLILEDTAGLLC